MDSRDPKLLEIWRQKGVPVLFRRQKPPLLVRLPYSEDNYHWLKRDKRHSPSWNTRYRCWETPVSWFDDVINNALKTYGKVYIIQLYRHQQKCAPTCWNAEGYHCECSCMGANHGMGHPGGNWREVSDTFAFTWDKKQYACRLLKTSTSPK